MPKEYKDLNKKYRQCKIKRMAVYADWEDYVSYGNWGADSVGEPEEL